ncbi:hypothetical protein BDN71DRAFT_1456803 [Pleurotus eryngii]|uniref:Uncharacterized protein n=1 Tax=Pleurotus eryngii TaxID=5323 RepID=A0A9P5ZLN3_PLEER|nr:hypothetical protein BDN71DRAFT_1456803 [Pleurotus eryngii]
MSSSSSFDFSSSTTLSYPSPAYLHVGGHLQLSTYDVRSYTDGGWRELYESDSFGMEAPPAYQREDLSLPSYHHAVRRVPAHTHTPTPLAKRLLEFGFFFPLLWLAGAILMFVAFFTRRAARQSSSLLPEKITHQKDTAYDRMLSEEIRWGLRCLWAFSIISCIVSGIILAVVF